jgi:hypothetical protein
VGGTLQRILWQQLAVAGGEAELLQTMLKEAPAEVLAEHEEGCDGLEVVHAEELEEDGGCGLLRHGRQQGKTMSPRCTGRAGGVSEVTGLGVCLQY